MKISEYTAFDALGLAELVRRREVTPSELMDAASAAIEQVNPALNAVISSLRDDAEQALRAGLPEGPFTGVPYLVKDLGLLVAGTPTGMGSRLFQGLVSPIDDELMARFRRAGLVSLGKTNTPELGLNVVTEPAVHGPTRNPWRRDRTPGGSSGGAAAAVAARMVPMAHGNDVAGSIRIPASCCGLFGLKPTRGRIPTGPIEGEVLMGFATDHALTRSVRDSAALLDAIAGPDAGAPYFAPPASRSFLEEARTPPGRLRIAFTDAAWSGVAVHDECKLAVRRAASLCEALGHEVVQARPEIEWERVRIAFRMLLSYAAHLFDRVCPTVGLAPGRDTLEAATLAMAEAGRRMSAVDVHDVLMARDQIARQLGQFFTRFDALLTPALAAPPIALGTLNGNDPTIGGEAWLDRIFEFAPFTPLFNVNGSPAMSVPLHMTADGMPVGVQFAGRYADDATLLRLAGQLEQAAPWDRRRPAICAE
ncbi:amidase [Sorangium sp. So ce1000]|uniref:amidase n=1 Tax=Sorangium sp. So ce1000 TaxID=3133325 RepID=UPI003F5FC989